MPDVVGTLSELAGGTCEAVLVQEAWHGGERLLPIHALYLKLEGRPWRRTFFDGGVLFVRTGGPPGTRTGPVPSEAFRYTVEDVGARHGLVGRRVVRADVREQGADTELRLSFDTGPQLVLTYDAAEDAMRLTVRQG